MGILAWLFSEDDEATGSTVAPALIDQRIDQRTALATPDR